MDTMVFSRSDVTRLLRMSDCIRAVEDAFMMLGRGEAPAPATLGVPASAGSFHTKAGLLRSGSREYFAVKTNGNFPGNRSRGLPTIQGLLTLSDASDGRLLAVMDSGEVTVLRTAAATAVAARYLARPDSARVVICGCGMQAHAQLAALCEVLPVREVEAYDVDAGAVALFASKMTGALNLPVRTTTDLAAALASADVCVTCTTSSAFIVNRASVRPGTFVAGVGVDNEHKRELAPDLLRVSKVVTDMRTQCARIGDLHHAIEAGMMTVDDVYADLADVVAGNKAGREDRREITIFDSTGIALQDVSAAIAIYENAARLSGGSVFLTINFAD
ncbi:MAG TPA: ornithine cyclodeaminase family protein [Longimicrobiales bacterium]